MTPRIRIAALIACAALVAVGCDSDDDDPAPTGTIVIQLEEVADGVAIVPYNDGSNTRYTNAAGNVYGVANVEYLLTDFTLLAGDHSAKHDEIFDGAHYRNAFEPNTATITLNDVPVGHYDGLSFWWGVSPEKNFGLVSGGPKGLPASFDDMLWPMGEGGGYHCMRFEGVYNKAGIDDHSFQLHMGRLVTGGGTVVTDGHSLETLDNFELHVEAGQTLHLTLTMDMNRWMNSPVIDFTASTPNGMALDGPTMPNHEAQALMRDNDGDVFTLEEN